MQLDDVKNSDNDELIFGVPLKRQKKNMIEKYPDIPILTLEAIEDETKNTKMRLNKKAYKVLNLNEEDANYMAFSFNAVTGEIVVINANKFDSGNNIRISKNGVMSNKKHFYLLRKMFNTPDNEDLEVQILDTGRTYKEISNLYVLGKLNSKKEEVLETDNNLNLNS